MTTLSGSMRTASTDVTHHAHHHEPHRSNRVIDDSSPFSDIHLMRNQTSSGAVNENRSNSVSFLQSMNSSSFSKFLDFFPYDCSHAYMITKIASHSAAHSSNPVLRNPLATKTANNNYPILNPTHKFSSSSSTLPSSCQQERINDFYIASQIPTRINQRLDSHIFFPHLDLEDLEHEPDPSFGYEKAMIAGASAGVMEHLAMFPVDTIKTRLQAPLPIGGTAYTGAVNAVYRIAADEGIPRLYRGVTAAIVGAIPSHAANYAAYEYLKERLGGNLPGHHPIAHATAGALSTLLHDAVITPMDVVKQRLQLQHSAYRGVIASAKTILKEEGLIAFYASYPTTVLLNVPFMAVYFSGYEFFKRLFGAGGAHHHDIVKELAAGACAGGCAGLLSTPLDVLKTRLQTQQVKVGDTRLTSTQMWKSLYRTEGMKVFWRGSTARMMYFIPSAAICWSTYETVKRVLKDAW